MFFLLGRSRILSTFLAVCAIIGLGSGFAPAGAYPLGSGQVVPIIDAGHGGADGGAVAPDGTIEADINLSIARKLELVFALCGYAPVMTRTAADIDYPDECDTIRRKKVYDQQTRLELINATENGVLISIHQNIFSGSSVSGAQVLYAPGEESQTIARSVQDALRDIAGSGDRVEAPVARDIYLMNNALCPAVLVECGFLSNAGDFAKLTNGDQQLLIACAVFAGVHKALQEE